MNRINMEVVAAKKKRDAILREHARSSSDEDLRFICSRFNQRLFGDLGEVVEHIQQFSEVDRVLSTAKDAMSFYDLLDEIQVAFENEYKRRSAI